MQNFENTTLILIGCLWGLIDPADFENGHQKVIWRLEFWRPHPWKLHDNNLNLEDNYAHRTLRVLAWRLTFKADGLRSSIASPNRTKNYPCFFFSFSTSNFSPRAILGNGFNTILLATHLFRCCHTTTYGRIILWWTFNYNKLTLKATVMISWSVIISLRSRLL